MSKATHDRTPTEVKSARAQAWARAHPERAREINRAAKARNREAISGRARERNATPEGKAAATASRKKNAAKRHEYDLAWRAANGERYKASTKEYYESNKEKIKDYHTQYRLENPDKYRQIHSNWKKRNKDAVNASTHKRRYRLKNGGSWTAESWERLKAQCNWRCCMCGRQEMTDGITLCFDHIQPVDAHGWNLISNAQTLCRSCNSLKHRKTINLLANRLRWWPLGI